MTWRELTQLLAQPFSPRVTPMRLGPLQGRQGRPTPTGLWGSQGSAGGAWERGRGQEAGSSAPFLLAAPLLAGTCPALPWPSVLPEAPGAASHVLQGGGPSLFLHWTLS